MIQVVPRDTSFRGLQRLLAGLLPDGQGSALDEGAPLEASSTITEPPRLISAAVIEGAAMRAHRVTTPGEAAFAGFLDGTQASTVLWHVDGVPIIRGTVSAVIRLRRNRRMITWRHSTRTRVYVPLSLLPPGWSERLDSLGDLVVDTTVDGGATVIEHPYAVRDAAKHFVQRHREAAEEQLANDWCGVMREPLFVDGPISGHDGVTGELCIVGVVKSHRTLYAEGDALRAILRLRAGERSSVFRVTSPRRATVASWYLRMRDPAGHDPMWGLVRVEVAYAAGAGDASLAARADEVSRWILAEATPIALPDARWDKMVYGIRDCEEFLRAIS